MSTFKRNRFYFENYMALLEDAKRKAEEEKKISERKNQEKADWLDEMNRYRKQGELKRSELGNYTEHVYNDHLKTVMEAIYISALNEASDMSNSGIELAKNLVDNYINEHGGARSIMSKHAGKTYLLDFIFECVDSASKKDIAIFKEAKDDEDKDKVERDKDVDNSDGDENESGEDIKLGDADGDGKDDSESDDVKESPKDDKKDSDKDKNLVDDLDSDGEDSDEEKSNTDSEEDDSKKEKESDENKDDKSTKDSDKDDKEDSDEDRNLIDDLDSEDEDDKKESEETDDGFTSADSDNTENSKSDESNSDEEDIDDGFSAVEDDVETEPQDDSESSTDEEGESKDSKEDMFDKLENDDTVGSAVEVIARRIADAESEFIKKNAEDKQRIEKIADKIDDRIKAVTQSEDKTSEEKNEETDKLKTEATKAITNIRNFGTKTIFEYMVKSNADYIVKEMNTNDIIQEAYSDFNGKLDIGKIVETTRVQYGFLEFLNTIQLEKVNESFLKENVLNI